jgi:hypothetical protein
VIYFVACNDYFSFYILYIGGYYPHLSKQAMEAVLGIFCNDDVCLCAIDFHNIRHKITQSCYTFEKCNNNNVWTPIAMAGLL